MVSVIMHGCCGKMGHTVASIVKSTEGIQIVAGVDPFDDGRCDFPVYPNLEGVKEKADVIIDFSSAKAVDALFDYCEKTGMPVVLCSTGLSKEQLSRREQVSKKAAVLFSANMSLGINLIMKVLGQISPILSEAGFDVEIVEKHHNQKLDAPSGTAIALADSINDSCEDKFEYIYDRSQRREKRDKRELGISAVRAGTIVGDHDVIFAGEDEVITISHRAYSKALFAKGAVEAAMFLAGKAPGIYSMSDVINL